MGSVTRAEMAKAKEMGGIFRKAAATVEWPPELDAALRPKLGADWDVLTLMAICSRESRFGLLLDKDGRGDAGHGLGLMQIDDRSYPEFAEADYQDPETNILKGAEVLQGKYNYLADHFELFKENFAALWWGAVAAYNCGEGNVHKALEQGRGVDYYTTGRDYSFDVKNRAIFLSLVIWKQG